MVVTRPSAPKINRTSPDPPPTPKAWLLRKLMLLPAMVPEPPMALMTSLRVAFRMLKRNGCVRAVQVIPWTVESGAASPQQVRSSG